MLDISRVNIEAVIIDSGQVLDDVTWATFKVEHTHSCFGMSVFLDSFAGSNPERPIKLLQESKR